MQAKLAVFVYLDCSRHYWCLGFHGCHRNHRSNFKTWEGVCSDKGVDRFAIREL